MRNLAPEFASTGSGIEKIQDKIARNLPSLKQTEERAFAARQQQSINDISTSVLKQMKEYLGEMPPDFEDLLYNNTKLSHMTERVRMGNSHVLSGVSDSVDRLGLQRKHAQDKRRAAAAGARLTVTPQLAYKASSRGGSGLFVRQTSPITLSAKPPCC